MKETERDPRVKLNGKRKVMNLKQIDFTNELTSAK